MERLFILATILWLSGFEIVHAQVAPGTIPGSNPRATIGTNVGINSAATSAATNAAAGSNATVRVLPPCASPTTDGTPPNEPCVSDPLNLPTATLSSGAGTTGAAATSGRGASSSIGAVSSPISAQVANPQAPLQLPGEASSTATQSALASTQSRSSTASQAGSPSTALCSAAMPSSTGTTNPANVFGGASLSGC